MPQFLTIHDPFVCIVGSTLGLLLGNYNAPWLYFFYFCTIACQLKKVKMQANAQIGKHCDSMRIEDLDPTHSDAAYVDSLVKNVYRYAFISKISRVIDPRQVPTGTKMGFYPIPMNKLAQVLAGTFLRSLIRAYGDGVYLTTRLCAFDMMEQIAVIICRTVVNLDQAVIGAPGIIVPAGGCALDNMDDPRCMVYQDLDLIYPEFIVTFYPVRDAVGAALAARQQ